MFGTDHGACIGATADGVLVILLISFGLTSPWVRSVNFMFGGSGWPPASSRDRSRDCAGAKLPGPAWLYHAPWGAPEGRAGQVIEGKGNSCGGRKGECPMAGRHNGDEDRPLFGEEADKNGERAARMRPGWRSLWRRQPSAAEATVRCAMHNRNYLLSVRPHSHLGCSQPPQPGPR